MKPDDPRRPAFDEWTFSSSERRWWSMWMDRKFDLSKTVVSTAGGALYGWLRGRDAAIPAHRNETLITTVLLAVGLGIGGWLMRGGQQGATYLLLPIAALLVPIVAATLLFLRVRAYAADLAESGLLRDLYLAGGAPLEILRDLAAGLAWRYRVLFQVVLPVFALLAFFGVPFLVTGGDGLQRVFRAMPGMLGPLIAVMTNIVLHFRPLVFAAAQSGVLSRKHVAQQRSDRPRKPILHFLLFVPLIYGMPIVLILALFKLGAAGLTALLLGGLILFPALAILYVKRYSRIDKTVKSRLKMLKLSKREEFERMVLVGIIGETDDDAF